MTQIFAHLIATCAHTWTRLRPGTLKSYETHVPSHLPSQGADVELSVLLLRKADAEGDGAPRASLGLDPPRLDPSASSAISLWANLEMGDRWSNWQRLSLFPGEVFEYDLGAQSPLDSEHDSFSLVFLWSIRSRLSLLVHARSEAMITTLLPSLRDHVAPPLVFFGAQVTADSSPIGLDTSRHRCRLCSMCLRSRLGRSRRRLPHRAW